MPTRPTPPVSIPTPTQRRIVEGAFRLLRPGGVFVQFTYGWRPPVDREVREALALHRCLAPLGEVHDLAHHVALLPAQPAPPEAESRPAIQ